MTQCVPTFRPRVDQERMESDDTMNTYSLNEDETRTYRMALALVDTSPEEAVPGVLRKQYSRTHC